MNLKNIFLFLFRVIFSCKVGENVSESEAIYQAVSFKSLIGCISPLEGLISDKLEAYRLLLVKCYDIKMVYSPFNWIIPPLIQPKVATQQKQKKYLSRKKICSSILIVFRSRPGLFYLERTNGKSNRRFSLIIRKQFCQFKKKKKKIVKPPIILTMFS